MATSVLRGKLEFAWTTQMSQDFPIAMTKIPASAVIKRAPLFLTNWTAANAEWQDDSNAEFILKNGATRAIFNTKVGVLTTLIANVDTTATQQTLLEAQRDALRAATHTAMSNWRAAAIYNVGNSPFGVKLPTLPRKGEAIASFLKTLEKANERWVEINDATDVPNFVAPMILKDGTTQPQFAASIAALTEAARTLETLVTSLPVDRARRDNAADEVYGLASLYRDAVKAKFPNTSPVLKTLPTLRAKDTGHTPTPVVLTGLYNPQTGEGDLNWTASLDPNFDHYEVKIAVATRYNANNALKIGELAQGVTSFSIPAQFLPVGASICAVIEVVLSDNRHKASNAIKFSPVI